MCHARRIVSDEIWERYAPYLPGRRPGAWGGSYPQYDNRTVLEAVLWVARTGATCRRSSGRGTLSASVSAAGVRTACSAMAGSRARLPIWNRIWTPLWWMERTFVKVHQHGAGAPKADARLPDAC